MPKGGNAIVYGKIQLSSESVPMEELERTLTSILNKHGYPEGEAPHDAERRREFERELEEQEKKLNEDFKRYEQGDTSVMDEEKAPWERGR